MHTYRVTWAIDIEAETPQQAAEFALETQRDENSIATVFDVALNEGDAIYAQPITIDLSNP